ncbi:MAG: amidase domain-containing protein [Ruminiclostridium sp.]
MDLKKLLTFIIILYFITLSISSVSAEPNNPKKSEEFVKEFLCAKMNTLITKNIDDLDKYYTKDSENSQKYLMFTKQELLQDYLIAYASNDYAIEKVLPQVNIISSTNKDDAVTVDAILKTEIYWNASNALGEPIVGMKSEKHLLTLIKENNEWKIIVDNYMTNRGHSDESIKADLTILTNTVGKLRKEAENSLGRSKRSTPTRLTMALSESQAKNSSKSILTAGSSKINTSSPTAASTYNRDGVYNWANTYWGNYSTAYVNLGSQKWEGGDCTNFVSQCLKAGGANNDKTGSYQWYYDSKGTEITINDSYSWTWSTARGLNYILLGNYKTKEYGPKGTEKVITGDSEYNPSIGQYIMLGDIIQYQWKPNSKITHAAVIVGILYNSSKERYEPVIAEHTYDSWYTPWTNNAYKTHFVHITGIN